LQLAKEGEGIDSRVMPVAPNDSVCVASDRSEVGYPDMGELLGCEVETLRGMVPLALGAGAEAPKHIEPVPARVPIGPFDLKDRIVVGEVQCFRECFVFAHGRG